MEKWKRSVNKITAILLTLTLILGAVNLSAFPVNAAENYGTLIEGGETGECQWAVYDSNGDETGDLLVISGEGPMGDRAWEGMGTDPEPAPWAAFCTNIETVILEPGVTTVGFGAFDSFENLTSATLPETVTEIKMGGFAQCCNLMSIELPAGLKTIGSSAFLGNGFTSIELPEGLETIGDHAFYYSKLTSIEIPEGITRIEESTFTDSWNITSVKLPNSLRSIGSYAFLSCPLESLEIPENVTEIGEGAFWGGRYESVKIPHGITDLAANVFRECSISHVEWPDELRTIGEGAFSRCSFRTIEIPESVTEIGAEAFMECMALTSIKIPEGVTAIEESSFKDCDNLTSVDLPENLRVIGKFAFSDCYRLNTINIPEKVTNIREGAFLGCAALKSIKIPQNVASIENSVFESCGLTSIVIPKNVTSIGDKAFYYNEFTSIEIPENVTSIGERAFLRCNDLNEVIYRRMEAPSHGIDVFRNTSSNLVAYVPKDASGYDNLSDYGNPDITVSKYGIEITQQPTNQSTVLGGRARFSVTAAGSAEEDLFTYQWQKQGSDGSWTDLPGANSDSYLLQSVTAADSGAYRCVVTLQTADLPLCTKISEKAVLTIGKVTPYIAEVPTAAVITYGQKLSDSVLSGGKVQYSSDSSVEGYDTIVEGSFVWDSTEIEKRPSAIADSNQTEYRVIFQPTDPSRFLNAETTVKIIVNKAPNAPRMPETVMNVSKDCTKVGSVTLPEGWIWQQADIEKELEEGIPLLVTAIYNGEDKGNYQTEAVEITITRSACNHTGGVATCTDCAVCELCGQPYGSVDNNNHGETELKNAQQATCTQNGYTGDTYCKECEQVITIGTTILAEGHKGGTATCAQRAVCSVCGQQYGELANSHEHTEIRAKKAVSCTEDGYTGDTYCTDCGSKIAVGETIEAPGHIYTSEVTEATCTEAGKRVFTCSCGDQYEEKIRALGHKQDIRNQREANCTQEGNTGDVYCSACGVKFGNGTITPALGHRYESMVTKPATRVEKGVRTYYCTRLGCAHSYEKAIPRLPKPKKGSIIKKSSLQYKVTKSDDKNGTVEFVKATSDKFTKFIVPNYIDIDGVQYAVTSIAADAFKICKSLEEVTIGCRVITIGNNAFSGCKKLTTVTMDSKVKTIGRNAFSGCKKLNAVTIGKNVKTIGKNAFSGCSSLKTLNMGANVTTINEKAFYQCTALTKITIPAKVNKIGKQALQGCKKLKTITIKTTKLTSKNVGAKAFMGIHAKAAIKVPKSKIKAYRKLLKAKGIGSKVKVSK